MINEDLSRKDIAKIKKLIRKEIESFKKKDLEKKLNKTIKDELKSFKKENEEEIEDITLNTLQKLFNMFYREKKTWQNKVKKN